MPTVEKRAEIGPRLAAGQSSWRHWLMAIRPKTLSIAIVPVLVGTSLAWSDHQAFTLAPWLAALAASILIQIGTNLYNDAADHARGIDDPATRLGPPRATSQGWLVESHVRLAAKLSFFAAFLLGCYLGTVGGWPIVLIGIAAIASGVAYSIGPYPISHSGFSELFVLVFFGLAAVGGSYYLQSDGLSVAALLAGLAVGAPAAAVLVVNNYRDLENDLRAGKRTLTVRLGRGATKFEFAALILLPFLVLPLLQVDSFSGDWWLLPWVALPLGGYLIWLFWTGNPGPLLNRLLAATARFQLVFGLLLCVDFIA